MRACVRLPCAYNAHGICVWLRARVYLCTSIDANSVVLSCAEAFAQCFLASWRVVFSPQTFQVVCVFVCACVCTCDTSTVYVYISVCARVCFWTKTYPCSSLHRVQKTHQCAKSVVVTFRPQDVAEILVVCVCVCVPEQSVAVITNVPDRPKLVSSSWLDMLNLQTSGLVHDRMASRDSITPWN